MHPVEVYVLKRQLEVVFPKLNQYSTHQIPRDCNLNIHYHVNLRYLTNIFVWLKDCDIPDSGGQSDLVPTSDVSMGVVSQYFTDTL
jgi:hypothetical protein